MGLPQYPLINYLVNYQVEECEVEANEMAFIGNGFCNDITNIRSCDFDGGDCCGENISTEFCEICTCHSDDLTTGNWKPTFWNPNLKTLILGCWKWKTPKWGAEFQV